MFTANSGRHARNRGVVPQRHRKFLFALLAAGLISPASAQDISDGNLDPENRAQRDKINGLLGSHNVAWGASWSPDPFVGYTTGSTAYTLNNILKITRPVLQEPPSVSVMPNSGDNCSYSLEYTHNVNEVYTDYLGLGPGFNPGAVRLDANWGILGKPTVYHGNSDVRVETRLNGAPFGLEGSGDGFGRQDVPVGRHAVRYTATTQISDLLDIPPWFALNLVGAVDGARKSLGRELLEAAVSGSITNFGPMKINELAGRSGIGSIAPRDTNARSERVQSFYVLDRQYPWVNSSAETVEINAINVGGRVFTPGLEREIRETTLTWGDPCREPDDVTVRLLDPPRFLPAGQDYVATWRVIDPGPSSLPIARPDPDFPDIGQDDTRNEVRITQVWQVRDRLPPVIEPPSGRVIESTGLQETVTLGKPAVFDLADPEARVEAYIDGVLVEAPTIDVPSLSRTEVTWLATDRWDNFSEKTQWITVKPVGTNTAPVSMAGLVSAVSFEDIDIELLGQDNDAPIGDRYDQLAFSISRPPENGEFIAPLFPFFIEDYRVEANLSEEDQAVADTDGDGLVNPIERIEFFRNWCDDPLRRDDPLPRDLVNMPEYITVDDSGTSFVRDIVYRCNVSGEVESDIRIAQFNENEELVAELLLPSDYGSLRSFWIGPDGFLYFKRPNEPNITQVDPTPVVDNPDKPPRMLTSRLVLDPPNDDQGFVRSLRDITSVATDANDLLYITDGAAVYVFDLLQTEPGGSSESIRFVGDLVPRGSFSPDASTNGGMDITIDSEGNVYFADEELHRIWKYGPSSYDRDNDVFVPGPQIGWLGRCSGNRTPEAACDTANQTSFGFACTDALCDVDTSPRDPNTEREECGLPPGSATFNKRAGCKAGQFDRPKGIAITGNDILYVADFNNFRIQRFNTDGMYGGEAVSECDGTCFVLGDFGKPVDVSVNLKHFYVLDREFDLLHVFETTPITNVEDANLQLVQNAFVTYRSNNNFRGMDTFEFHTSDGLADSEPATVTINVTRNQRAPEAIGSQQQTLEDVPIDITLRGTDADADALSYMIIDPPANGTLEGDAPNIRYVPAQNYAGLDAFTFVVIDEPGADAPGPSMTSEPAVVAIEILPAPDDPTLELEFAERTGVAYDTVFAAYSFDPDIGDIASVTIEWGDGRVQAATRDTQAIGIWPVIYDDSSFEARVEGSHIYNNPGEYTIRVCVSDSVNGASLSTCNEPEVKTLVEQTIIVDELIDLVVTTDDDLPKFEEPDCPHEARDNDECPMRSEPVIDGNPVTYTATIENAQLGDNTSPATNIEATFEFPPELTPQSVMISAPDASTVTASTIDGHRVIATISSLAIEQQATVSVIADTPGNLLEDRRVDISGQVRRVAVVDGEVVVPDEFADPSGRNPIARQTEIKLDPAGDADGDGVVNANDAFPGDPTESRDNDSDGIGDNADLDDDNDRMPDTWERRFGYDPFNAGEADLDPDGDGISNADEYAAGSRPDFADSDRDGVSDSADACPTTFDRNQFDGDLDNEGDACDPQSFASGVAVGDINGSGSTDFALVATAGGDPIAYLKDGESNFSVGANMITVANTDSETIAGIASADNRLAALKTAVDDQPVIQAWDAITGVSAGSVAVFDAAWNAQALEALNLADPQLLVIANEPGGTVGIERRRADTGVLIAAASPLAGYEALSATSLESGAGYAVLAYELDSGALTLLAASSSDDAELQRWTISGNDWLQARVAASAAGYAVAWQRTSGAIEITVLSPSSDIPVASFSVFDPDWALLETDYVGAGLAVMAADGSGEIQVRVVADIDGSELARESYHSSSALPRSLVAAATDLGALASTATGAVTLELRNADGSNQRLLTAESTSAPPPPPPPPPPTPTPSGGGGGGGAVGIPWLLALWMFAFYRRRSTSHRLRSAG